MYNPKNMSRRAFLAGGALAAMGAGLGLAGCGTDAHTAASPAAGEDGAPRSGTITASCAYASTNYTPIDLCGGSALMIPATMHVFEGLYELDLTSYKPYAALAAGDLVKVSDTEYEVTLREGAKFSDGTSVTVDDVVNAFEKNMDGGALSALLSFINSVAAVGDNKVSIMLNHPFDNLIKERLSLVKVFPAAREEELTTLPIGTGPWMYVEGKLNGEDGGSIEFVPNPNYNGPKPARAASMLWHVNQSDAKARVDALVQGTSMAAEAIPDGEVDRLVALGTEVRYVQSFGLAFLMFNTLKAPLNDKRVRQAFHYAIDTDKLIANVMHGHAASARSFLNEGHPNYHEAANVFEYNPEKAKALLEEAGVSDLSIVLTVNNNWVQDLGPQIKEDLEAVGIATTLDTRAIDWPAYGPVLESEGGQAIKPEGDKVLTYDVVLSPGDPTCYGNDADLLLSWWYSDNIWTQGRTFWKFADDSQFEAMQELLQEARESTDPAHQQDLWNRCFDIISEDVPLYPLFHRQLATGWNSNELEGFKPLATTGMIFLDASVIEQD